MIYMCLYERKTIISKLILHSSNNCKENKFSYFVERFYFNFYYFI